MSQRLQEFMTAGSMTSARSFVCAAVVLIRIIRIASLAVVPDESSITLKYDKRDDPPETFQAFLLSMNDTAQPNPQPKDIFQWSQGDVPASLVITDKRLLLHCHRRCQARILAGCFHDLHAGRFSNQPILFVSLRCGKRLEIRLREPVQLPRTRQLDLLGHRYSITDPTPWRSRSTRHLLAGSKRRGVGISEEGRREFA